MLLLNNKGNKLAWEFFINMAICLRVLVGHIDGHALFA
jgi:hypothetical protein